MQYATEVAERGCDVRGIGAQGGLEDRQGSFKTGPRPSQVPLLVEHPAEVGQGGGYVGRGERP